jgi:hypothetical protein
MESLLAWNATAGTINSSPTWLLHTSRLPATNLPTGGNAKYNSHSLASLITARSGG